MDKKLKLRIKNKNIELKVREMKGINKLLGLMVYRNSNLLFRSKKRKYPIHSLFCPKFMAIWLNNTRIVDIRLVTPWKLVVKPREDYNMLIEMPIRKSNSKIKKTLLEFVSFLDAQGT